VNGHEQEGSYRVVGQMSGDDSADAHRVAAHIVATWLAGGSVIRCQLNDPSANGDWTIMFDSDALFAMQAEVERSYAPPGNPQQRIDLLARHRRAIGSLAEHLVADGVLDFMALEIIHRQLRVYDA
jgi:hypothetical protein